MTVFTQFSYTSFMNCRIASSVCGEVGLAAMELEEVRTEAAAKPPPRTELPVAEDDSDALIKLPTPPPPAADVDDEGS
jgi:hypothetical protein